MRHLDVVALFFMTSVNFKEAGVVGVHLDLSTNSKGSGGKASMPNGIDSGEQIASESSKCVIRLETIEKATLYTIL